MIYNKYCNYRFDNKSNLGGVRAAENAQKEPTSTIAIKKLIRVKSEYKIIGVILYLGSD